jgi:VCBS repeat-containing protein
MNGAFEGYQLFDQIEINTVEQNQYVTEIGLTVDGLNGDANGVLSFVATQNGSGNKHIFKADLSHSDKFVYNVIINEGTEHESQVTYQMGSLDLAGSNTSITLSIDNDFRFQGYQYQNIGDVISSFKYKPSDALSSDLTFTLDSVTDSGSNSGGNQNTSSPDLVSTLRTSASSGTVDAAPLISLVTTKASQPEDLSGVSLFSSVVADTVDSAQTLIQTKLSVTNVEYPATEYLTIGGKDYALDGTDNDANVKVTYNADTKISSIIWDHNYNAADYSSALENVSYRAEQNNGIIKYRVISVEYVVDSGNSTNGASNTSTSTYFSTVLGFAEALPPSLVTIPNDPSQGLDLTEQLVLFKDADVSAIEADQVLTELVISATGISGNGSAQSLHFNADGQSYHITLDDNSSVILSGGDTAFATVVRTGDESVITFDLTQLIAGTEPDISALISSFRYTSADALTLTDEHNFKISSLSDNGPTDRNLTRPEIVSKVVNENWTPPAPPLDQAPMVLLEGLNPTWVAAGDKLSIFSNVTVNLIESDQKFTELTIKVIGLEDKTKEFIAYSLPTGEEKIYSMAELESQYSAFETPTGEWFIRFTSSSLSIDTASDLEKFIESIKYKSTGEVNGTRVISIDSLKDSGRNADGHLNRSKFTNLTSTVSGKLPNRAPVWSVATGDSAAVTLDETDSTLTASGSVTLSDADGDAITPTVSAVMILGDQGSYSRDNIKEWLTISEDLAVGENSDQINWSFTAPSLDYLDAGDILTLNYRVAADDGQSTSYRIVKVTITGTDDAPTLSVGQVIVVEDGGTVADAQVVATDPDSSPTFIFSATAPAKGTLKP